jgi:acetyl-CoA C-acetyltransferase
LAFEQATPQPYVHCNIPIPEQVMAHSSDPIVILSYARTPMGSFQGALSGVSATELGATAVKAAVERAGLSGDQVDKVFMGNVLSAGLGQAPARQAAIGAGLSQNTEAVTVNKVCGSGMQATIFAHDMLNSGSADVIVAGGMESMTNAPYLSKKYRSGARIGHDTVYDHMMLDGLEDAYEPGRAMGTFAEEAATEYQFTREDMDAYAIESLRRANEAITSGKFEKEIVGVTVVSRKGEVTVDVDEQPGKGNPEKIPQLRAAFAKDGRISDGAAALVLTRQSIADKLGKTPVARVVAHAAAAQEPARFTSAPVPALHKVLEKAGWSVDDVDLFEVNEAFACVAMIAMRDLGIPHEKINVNGGATALGHPIGASGARITTTLIAALQDRGLKRGVASLCIGGGEATALAVELVD